MEVQIYYEFRDFYVFKTHGILSGMGPYGSMRAHIKTGRSHMAQDHFLGYHQENPKIGQETGSGGG